MTQGTRILVVDDDHDVRTLLRIRLERLQYTVSTAATGVEALEKLAVEQPTLVLLDLKLPALSGVEVLRHIRREAPDATVIVMTAYATVQKAVEAMKEGAYDFLTKPLTPGHVELVIEKALERQALLRSDRLLQEEIDWKTQPIIGDSDAIRRAVDRAHRAAASSSTVLLLGESGTGKEVFARAIHAWSTRRRRPFVVVNCAALSEELLASDLFGHEKGAFTSAHQRRQGRLELANEGSVFLDEIGEMQPTLQTKLLRVLEDHSFTRVGGSRTIEVDIRVIAATNRDLAIAVKDGKFREDLFFRLNVIPITLPPLRDRRDDVLQLTECFLEKHCNELKRQRMSLSPEAREALVQYDWPGNVRELHNLLERAVVLACGDTIFLEDLALPAPASSPTTGVSTYQAQMDAAERDVIVQALRDHGGDKRRAARALGIALSTFYARLKNHRIS
jgi:DNA-binding NtrC family response regulator